MKILLLAFQPGELSESLLHQIKSIVPDRRVLLTNSAAEVEANLAGIEIAVTGMGNGIIRELILEAPNLRWLQQWGAGADWLFRSPEAVERDFILTNASGVHAVPISEHILALMLAFARRIHTAVRDQANNNWGRPSRGDLFELVEKTLCLVGVGAIGGRLARIAAALGMRVLGVRRNPHKAAEGVHAMYGPERLLELLPEADFLVLTAPLTSETRNMVTENELRAMKRTAYIVNIGRGTMIVESALIRALQEGWIAGAGLDVFEQEPLPADSPLWKMHNVIVTSHYAGLTPRYNERAMAIFLDNLERYARAKPLRNVVDKRLGY